MPLTSRVEVRLTADQRGSGDLVESVMARINQIWGQDLADGSAANQANKLWSDTRTLTTGQTEDIDLNGGGLLDAFGVAVNFVGIKALAIRNRKENTTNLTVGGDVNSVPLLGAAASTFAPIKPGGVLLILDPSDSGIVVTPGTGDILQVANSAGASATYDVVIIGE